MYRETSVDKGIKQGAADGAADGAAASLSCKVQGVPKKYRLSINNITKVICSIFKISSIFKVCFMQKFCHIDYKTS